MIASQPAPDASSVAWLLLQAVPTSGSGKFANVAYIAAPNPRRCCGDRRVYERRKAGSLYSKIQLLHGQAMTVFITWQRKDLQRARLAMSRGARTIPS